MKGLKPIYNVMHKISQGISKLIGLCAFLLTIACALTVLLQVINRYIIVKISNYSASFTDELSRFLLVWIAYIVVAICLREGSMAQVDMIYSRLSPKGCLAMYLFTRAIMGAVLYVIIRYGMWFAARQVAYRSAMMQIPGNILYAAIPIGGILMSFEWLTELIGVLSGIIEPFKAGSQRAFPEHEDISANEAEQLEAFGDQLAGEIKKNDANEMIGRD